MAKTTEGPGQRIHQMVAQKMGTSILSGVLQPGEHIPGEIEQSAAMGVSRTAYREAIRILTAKGLLESRPKAGTRITAREKWNLLDPEMLAWMFMGKPNKAFALDLFELRNLLEPEAAQLAAHRRKPEHLDAMAQALDDMREFGLATAKGQAGDHRFHTTLLAAAGNLALASLASSIGAAVKWTTFYKQAAYEVPRDPLPEHLAVYHAIKDRDPAGARARMEELIALAAKDMGLELASDRTDELA